jgi:cystathionine beta-lyase/cystathionine gamma-synthase
MIAQTDTLTSASDLPTTRLETRTVHGGRDDFVALGVHAPPLDLSSTYPVPDLTAAVASIDALVAGGGPQGSMVYSRLHNPTVARAEQAIADLERARATVAFASGMAAWTAALLVARGRGAHVVAVRPLYGSADHLLASGLLGLEVTFTTPDRVAASCRGDTALVCVETPANPTLDLVDIGDVVRQADGVPVMVDATFATPILLNPLDHGATLVLHSATKALAGHGDVLAGVVSSNDEAWIAALRQVRLLTGSVLHPMAAWLLHRGLPTLALRVERAQANAQTLAARLAAHPAVTAVHYPGQGGTDPRGVLGRELRGPGSTLAFELAGDDAEAPARLLAALDLITPAVSLGSVDTLIQHPASLTHRVVDGAVRDAHGITARLLRLSVGVEHIEDLWQDLQRGLATVTVRATASATPAAHHAMP